MGGYLIKLLDSFLSIDKIFFKNFLTNFKKKRNIKSDIGIENKIFIIGKNKTGTTSLHVLFKELGFEIGSQVAGEHLIWDIEKKDFSGLKRLCESGQVFQDIPFSLPKIYEYLYEEYPDAYFINLERENEEIWYDSLTGFHKKILKKQLGSDELTISNLSNFVCSGYKGYFIEIQRIHYGISGDNIYDERICKNSYTNHIKNAKEFFKDNKKFISINLKDNDASLKLAKLLNISEELVVIPHANKT